MNSLEVFHERYLVHFPDGDCVPVYCCPPMSEREMRASPRYHGCRIEPFHGHPDLFAAEVSRESERRSA